VVTGATGLCFHVRVDQPPSEPDVSVLASAALLRRRVAVEPMWLPVRGQSMRPALRDGWEVRVEPATRPRRGEVWAFYGPDGVLVVHRCRRVRDGVHRFAGDALPVADPPVRDGHLIGRVSAVRGAGAEHTVTWRDGMLWRATYARRSLRVRLARRSAEQA
jgi:hypothetical protein